MQIQKQIDELKGILDKQQEQLDSMKASEDYLSQIFMTREEFPALKELTDTISGFERRLAKTEGELRSHVEDIETEAIEQRKLIEKIQRRKAIHSMPAFGPVLRAVTAVFSGKQGSLGRKK